MREGELLPLTVTNFKTQILNITKSYSRLNGQDLIKNQKYPYIIILPFLCSIVLVYMNPICGLYHSHTSFLVEQGFSPLVIKERLGHENIKTTLNTYSHLYPYLTNKTPEYYEKNWGKCQFQKEKSRNCGTLFSTLMGKRSPINRLK